MADPVEERFEVQIDDVLIPCVDVLHGLPQGLVRIASRPESVAVRRKVRFPQGAQYLVYRLLDQRNNSPETQTQNTQYMKLLLHTCLLLSLISSLGLHAQERPADLSPTDHFIYLHDNTLLREVDFEVKQNLLSRRFFFPSGEKINLADIKYFQDKKGYYAVFSSGYDTAKRLEYGTIDLFVKYDYVSTGPGPGGISKSYYYARGFGDLKRLQYKNLKADLILDPDPAFKTQNELINKYLEKNKTRRTVSLAMLGGGLATFLVGGLIYESGDGPVVTPAQRTGLAICLAGILTAGISVTINRDKPLMNALKEYNKVY